MCVSLKDTFNWENMLGLRDDILSTQNWYAIGIKNMQKTYKSTSYA